MARSKRPRKKALRSSGRKQKTTPVPLAEPRRNCNPRGAPEGYYPPVEYKDYPEGEYEAAGLRVIRKRGEGQIEEYRLLDGSHARQPQQHYASVQNFNKYYIVEVKWRLADNGVTFLYNKTTLEPLQNVLCSKDMKRGCGTFTWAELEPMTRQGRLGSWMVVGGEGSGRLLPTLPEQMQLAHGTPGAGAKQLHTDELYCAHNALSNVLGLSSEDDQQLRAQAGPKMHIKAYGELLQKHSPYHRLGQVDTDTRKATRSPANKLKWLLDTTARGGYKNEDPLHTGCMLVGVGAHVVGWDTRAGLMYDPYTEIEVALPATKEVVDALHLNQIDFFRVITNTHKQIERKKRE
jgi:hypothetical protein